MRKARGQSPNELAERANVNDKYLGEIDNVAGNPSLEVLMKVAKALGGDLATVVGDPLTLVGRTPPRQVPRTRAESLSRGRRTDLRAELHLHVEALTPNRYATSS